LGRTTHLQIKRQSFYPKGRILSDIEKLVESHGADYVTFVGDGEPTLSKDLGWLIKQCKMKWPIPVAVITNGSLFYEEDVRNDLLEADTILPTLDAGSEEIFKVINRPHPQISFDKMLQGHIDFCKEFDGQIWEEVMLVEGVNDSQEALESIRDALDAVNPDRTYVNVPIRPPAEPWVKVPGPKKILRAQETLGKTWDISNYEEGGFEVSEFKGAREAILELGSRHPLREEQARGIEKNFGRTGVVDSMIIDGTLLPVDYRKKKYFLLSSFRMGT
jgi:wyosine [tRNA(Phe)-imidazoG37] synthetase (radical SAM superfamily)